MLRIQLDESIEGECGVNYSKEEIAKDLKEKDVREFYMKYLLRADNWYFENILGVSEKDIIHAVDDFKMLVSESMDIGFNNVVMVGSGKIGYSLSPNKFLKPFYDEGDEKSDIDIAIISPNLFDYFWRLFRKSYNVTNKKHYKYIARGIYRGYISDTDLMNIDNCRVEWLEKSNIATKKLQRRMYFRHEIHYRIYRDWKDLEEYHVDSIEQLKGELNGYGK